MILALVGINAQCMLVPIFVASLSFSCLINKEQINSVVRIGSSGSLLLEVRKPPFSYADELHVVPLPGIMSLNVKHDKFTV